MATDIIVPSSIAPLILPPEEVVLPEPVTPQPEPTFLKTDLRRHTLKSPLLGGKREIVVYLPPDYEKNTAERYPVLYMQDGQNLFDPETSFVKGNPWRLDQAAETGIKAEKIKPLIIVGIYNAGDKRIYEYTPTKDPKHRKGGKAKRYLRALLEDVKPFIDKTYRTMPCAHNTGVGGSSLGGLFALYAAMEAPQVFGRVAAMSPSAWWDRRMIVGRVASMLPKPRQTVWLDIGTNEGLSTLEDARKARDAFESAGWIENNDLMYTEAKDAGHDEGAWAARSRPMLEFLFPA